MIADKTKAALQSCQCHYQKLKQNKNTRVNAGGQNLTQLNFEGADFSGFFSQRNSAPTDFTQLLWQSPKVSFAYNSLIPAFFLTLGKKGGKSNPTLCFLFLQSDYRVSQIRALTIQYVEYAVATKKTTAIASRHLPRVESGITHSSGSALAFLRCRRLISPCNEVTINCAVLSPGSFKLSTLLAISCGTRALIFCDLLLTLSTAITGLLTLLWVPVYTKKSKLKHLMWVPVVDYSGCQMSVFAFTKKQRPTSVGSAGGASNHKPLVEVTVMAGSQHTQTHPEFTWRFLSTSERNPTAKPLVIYVNASSEQEARDTMPGVTLIFAARLPFHAFQAMEVRHE